MKLLVTGGAGFIGGNFVKHILEKYPTYEVICLDLLTYAGNLSTLEECFSNPNFTFIKGDITDTAKINELFESYKPDWVINFAAESHVDRSIENPKIFIETNIIGTQNLLDACKTFKTKKFHQVSTDEVYGSLPLNRPDLLFTEESCITTSSPYSASKAGADLLCIAYVKTFKMPITISRCSNNYGPYHFPEKLIPLVITRALDEQSVPVYGEGANVRDWLYVKDHCRAIETILHKGKEGEIYNIGGNSEKTNLEVVKTVLSALGKNEDLITFVKDRPGHDLRYAIDASKIKQKLGWEPATSFEKGIAETVDWYIKNKTWWQNIISGDYKNYYQKMYSGR